MQELRKERAEFDEERKQLRLVTGIIRELKT